jgi:hypothetical protein
MANISKAKEIYKSTPNKVNPNRPLIPVHGLYVAGLYRPPYWIDSVLNIVKLSTATAANVVYYTDSTDVAYTEKNGVIQLIDIDISDMIIVEYGEDSDSSYEKDGIVQLTNIDIGELDVLSFGNDESDVYTEKNGIIQLTNIDIDNFEILLIGNRSNTQPPGLPQLNIKRIGITTNAVVS